MSTKKMNSHLATPKNTKEKMNAKYFLQMSRPSVNAARQTTMSSSYRPFPTVKEQLCRKRSSPHYRIFPAQPEDNLAEVQNKTAVLFASVDRLDFYSLFSTAVNRKHYYAEVTFFSLKLNQSSIFRVSY